MSQTPTIIIIGAGVIGLSTALTLQQTLKETPSIGQLEIVLVACEWPGSIPGVPHQHSVDYASMWAGAHVRPIPAVTPQLQKEAQWLKKTVWEFDRLAAEEPTCGVTRTVGVEYLEAPDAGYQQQDETSFANETGLSGYRKYAKSELPDGTAVGYEYETFCIHPPMYCEALLRKFVLDRGKTLQKDLRGEWEAFSLVENPVLVINASGTGFGDPNCFPTRGQTVVTGLVDVRRTVTKQNRDGTWSFLIPRFFNGGTIVGGTKEPGDWRSTPCISTRQKLLEEGLILEPLSHGDGKKASRKAMSQVAVISDVVGRRPTRRGGMRIEVEEKMVPQHMGEDVSRSVIHAYGAGGRGYEISWGVAKEVVALALPLLSKASHTEAKF
ncbi:hypothetical protein ED733_007135 [Metarhizium rileyi]|uniref:FAD dependent oxidoreductase domain-containing protein n=1 Tax=Metarhizium rileyi (strain RCEF 4871) TaxID=1649241 RepID=A0A5C6GF05_METRR|nr:hypothetical protein ED733_007135 [Metarhizium rileyi]